MIQDQIATVLNTKKRCFVLIQDVEMRPQSLNDHTYMQCAYMTGLQNPQQNIVNSVSPVDMLVSDTSIGYY